MGGGTDGIVAFDDTRISPAGHFDRIVLMLDGDVSRPMRPRWPG
jgi:hypothetical protein